VFSAVVENDELGEAKCCLVGHADCRRVNDSECTALNGFQRLVLGLIETAMLNGRAVFKQYYFNVDCCSADGCAVLFII